MASLLVLSPHPDDETLYFGGLIRRAIKSNFKVHVAYITSGHNGRTLGLVSQKDLWKTREDEAAAAAKTLGVTDTFFMHYRDYDPSTGAKPLWRGASKQLTSWAKSRITDKTLVVSLPPNGMNGHPDHVKSSSIANKLASDLGLDIACVTSRKLVDYPEKTAFLTICNRQKTHILPTHAVSLLPDETAVKLNALACYETQALSVLGHLRRNGGRIDEETYSVRPSGNVFAEIFSPVSLEKN